MKRKVWQVLLGLGVGAAFFYWAFQGFSWEEVLHIRVDGIYLLGASGAMLSAHFLRAWRWVLYAQVSSPHKPPVGLFFHALMAGYAVNQILPRVGELVRCTLLSRVSPLSLVMLLGTVVAERVIDILSLGVVLLTLLVGDWARIVALLDLSGRLNPMGMVGIGVVGLFGVGLFIFVYRHLALPAGVRKLIQNFTQGFLSAWRVRRPFLHLGLTVGIWLMYGASTFLALRSILPQISLWEGWYLLGGSSVAIALPSPGGIGTFHAIGKVILEGLGYPTQKALSAMLVVHGFQYFLALLVGIGSGLYLLSLSYAKSHHSES